MKSTRILFSALSITLAARDVLARRGPDDAQAPAKGLRPRRRARASAAQPVRGQDPPAEAATISSTQGNVNDDDFDSDEDVSDISDEILRQRMEQRLKQRRGGNARRGAGAGFSPERFTAPAGRGAGRNGGVNFGNAANDVGATTLGGGASSKITPGKGNGFRLEARPARGYGPDIITNFDFPDADIVEIAKTLGRLTQLNFILDKDVKGRISIVSNGSQITVGDAWESVSHRPRRQRLLAHPVGAYIRIARQRDAKDKQIKTYSGDFSPDNDLYITRVLPLKYISADEVSRVFRNFMPPNTRIISYDQTNTLIITDTAANIKKIVDMVQLLDVEGYDEGLEVIQIKYARGVAQDIAKLHRPAAARQPGHRPRHARAACRASRTSAARAAASPRARRKKAASSRTSSPTTARTR